MSIITLPRSAVKEITDEYVIVEISENIEPLADINLDVIKSAFGLLKGREVDPLDFQRELRDEWDREITTDE